MVEHAWAEGDAVLPLSPTTPDAEVVRILDRLRPSELITLDPEGQLRRGLLPDGRPVAGGTALVVVTSGSTGDPKGVVLSHAALQASTAASIERLGCRRGEPWLLSLPLSHVAGIQVLLRCRALDSDAVILPRFDPELVAAAEAVHVSLVPTQLHRLLEAGVEVSGFRTILLGGAPAAPELLEQARAAGANVVTSYGMTETCGGCVYDGIPLADVTVELRDRRPDGSGTVAVRAPMLFDGYRDDTGTTSAPLDDGWFVTADHGRFDPDGRLEVLGRGDDVIVTGGENVAAAAVADALQRHPSVADAAVVGRPDPEWGQIVVAVVVPDDPGDPPSLDSLRRFVRTELGAAAAPRDLVVVDALPRDDMGKVTRASLQGLL